MEYPPKADNGPCSGQGIKKPGHAWIAVALLLVIHSGLLAYSASVHSPTLNEPAHLVAGLSHWEFGRFDLYRVNPPLTRLIAAIPVMLVGYEEDWSDFHEDPGARPVFVMGSNFIKANGERSIWLFTIARWACIPLSLLGCWFTFRFAEDLYGGLAGLTAATLWCFSPNVLAHGEWITPDCAGATFGIAASYLFWRWLRNPTWARAAIAGLFLGLAELAKTTWIVLFVLWPLLWLFWLFTNRTVNEDNSHAPTPVSPRLIQQFPQLSLILLSALYLLNLAYGFEGSFTPLGQFQFISTAFTGLEEAGEPGNRFDGTFLAIMPVPLPANYVRGIDIQKNDFESYRPPNYLRGEWKDDGGWWYYYLYAWAVKGALGIWLLFFVSLCVRGFRLDSLHRWHDELLLLTPALAVLILASTQTEINAHLRYILPVIGFAIIYASRAVTSLPYSSSSVMRLLPAICVIWTAAATLSCYPHHMAYFNELVGGPENGGKHLLGSNLDWGQDLLFVRKRQEELLSTERRPGVHFILSHVVNYDPGDLGVLGCETEIGNIEHISEEGECSPATYWIISKNYLHDPSHEWWRRGPFVQDGEARRERTLQCREAKGEIGLTYSVFLD